MSTKTKKSNNAKNVLLNLLLSLYSHVVITSKKIVFTSFADIANIFNENSSYEKYDNLLNIIRIKLNNKLVTQKQLFVELKKLKKSKSKFHAEIEYIFLFNAKIDIVYTLLDKNIKSKFVPLYALQTINETDKNFLVSLPKSLHADFFKHDSFPKIISHVDCSIRKLFEKNHVRSLYKI